MLRRRRVERYSRRLGYLCALFILFYCSTSASSQGLNAPAASDAPLLTLGQKINQNINGGDTQWFRVQLTIGQYVSFRIEQQRIILRAAILDDQHNRLVESDNPGGGFGTIHLSTVAKSTGEFKLQIRSPENWANPGSYTVTIRELRPAMLSDNERVAAETDFAEGRQLFEKGTAEDRKKAVEKYESSLRYWKSIQDAYWQVKTLYSLGATHRRLGDLQKASQYFKDSIDNSLVSKLEQNDWRLVATVLNDSGLNHADSGRYDEALDSLNRAFDLFQKHNDLRGQASVWNNRGYTYSALGNFDTAIENYQKSIPLREAEKDLAGKNNVISNIIAMYFYKGEPHRALSMYASVLPELEELEKKGELKDPDQLASAYNNIASVYDSMGQPQQALEAYKKAWEKLKNKQGRMAVATLDNTGLLYFRLGDEQVTTALKYYEDALKLFPAVNDAEREANVLTHMGEVYLYQNRTAEAFEKFSRALTLRENKRTQPDALTHLGAAYFQQQNFPKAVEQYDKALTLLGNGDKHLRSIAMYKRGEAYYFMGKHSQALEDLNKALVLWKEIADPRGEASTLQRLAQIEQDLNHPDRALQLNTEGLHIVESFRTNISSNQLRTSYFATQQEYYELSIDLNMALYKQDRSIQRLGSAFEASERARARTLADMLNETRSDIRQHVDKELLDRYDHAQQRLNSLEQTQISVLNARHTKEQAAAIEQELITLFRESDEIWAQIRTKSPNYAQLTQPQPLSLRETQQQLDADTVLLEYALGGKRSHVWVITPDSIDGFELPRRAEIEKTARRVTSALTMRPVEAPRQQLLSQEKEYAEASSELSRMILSPVASLIGRKRLVVVVDGALQLIPFAALPLPNGMTSQLISQNEIIYLPSASVLALQRRELANRKPAARAIAVFANPVFEPDDERVTSAKKKPAGTIALNTKVDSPLKDALRDVGLDRLSRLPYSRAEAAAIMSVAPKGGVLAALDFEANRASVLSPELSKYRIIHFATHGILNMDHPELSAIVLSLVDKNGAPQDGYVFLHDIYNLNLPAELVVLSACQTGIGKQVKGEGLIALTRGFMYAGAARLVASLWKVDDAATAALMKEFYKQMFVDGKKPAAALQGAQVYLRGTRRWNSPVYWAGFFIQGEWR